MRRRATGWRRNQKGKKKKKKKKKMQSTRPEELAHERCVSSGPSSFEGETLASLSRRQFEDRGGSWLPGTEELTSV